MLVDIVSAVQSVQNADSSIQNYSNGNRFVEQSDSSAATFTLETVDPGIHQFVVKDGTGNEEEIVLFVVPDQSKRTIDIELGETMDAPVIPNYANEPGTQEIAEVTSTTDSVDATPTTTSNGDETVSLVATQEGF